MLGLSRRNTPADAPTKAWDLVPTVQNAPHQISNGQPGFPAALAAIASPARVLWFRGRLPDPGQPVLAIVGARAATLAGCGRARELAVAAARAGYAIVSGGALGIDAAAHRGALEVGGATFAVLGCGVDVVYPDRHAVLFDEIAERGGLLSEYPPGTPPRGRQFPVRNRLVAGLAGAVVVVEAQPASGALVTARLAERMGRRLLAVPGSAGTDALIATGKARPVGDGGQLLRVLAGAVEPERVAPSSLAPLLAVLSGREAQAVEIARRLELPLPATLGLLAEAELDGWIRRRPGGTFASLEEVLRGN
jgi:DNA processing protein